MNQFVLTCCSTADMDKDFFETREIPFVCFHYLMDGRQYPDDLGQSMTHDEFFSRISKGAMPTTSQVNVSEFISFFEPILEEGKDILHISFSSGLSGSYNSACIARDELLLKYPNRVLQVVDSLCASSGYGLLVDAAADRRDRGDTLEEVRRWTEENKLRVHHWFFSTDLTHYKRGGRISATSAMVGTVLNICPLMNMDREGHLIPRQKVRTKKKVIDEIVRKMEEHAQDGLNYSGKCFISYSACQEDARSVARLVEEKFAGINGKVRLFSIGGVIGSHTGPGTVALFFFGDLRKD